MLPESDELPRRLRELVEGILTSRERVCWVGQPLPMLLARRELSKCVWGAVFTGFSMFALWAVCRTEYALVPPRTGLLLLSPFLVLSLYILSYPLWVAHGARKTAYVLTDQRAIIIVLGGFGVPRIRSFAATEIISSRVRTHGDGTGDVIFAEDVVMGPDLAGPFRIPSGFLAVSDARTLHARIGDFFEKTTRR